MLKILVQNFTFLLYSYLKLLLPDMEIYFFFLSVVFWFKNTNR